MTKRASCAPCVNKRHAALLTALVHSDSKQRLALLKNADDSFVRCICECALNVLRGNVPVKNKNRLRKHKSILRKLVTLKAGEKKRWAKKKRIILQTGGAFLPALIAPVLGALIARLIKPGN
ncbi:hypothetical protein TKK_0016627 [Trichogramma kaykai]|uniref:Uncharacterized protein n=1 Tax=Trichogramma kaykai TaxID=54128 RepID=A0ABD2W5H1_9HYME